MNDLRRVCSWCKRLIIGVNEPGEPAGAMTDKDTHGCCSECLNKIKRQIEEQKQKRTGQSGPWNAGGNRKIRHIQIIDKIGEPVQLPHPKG